MRTAHLKQLGSGKIDIEMRWRLVQCPEWVGTRLSRHSRTVIRRACTLEEIAAIATILYTSGAFPSDAWHDTMRMVIAYEYFAPPAR